MNNKLGVGILLAALVGVACSSSDSSSDGGANGDGQALCPGGSTSGTVYELPAGKYRGTIKALDAALCGIASSTQGEDALLEVEVTESSITLEPTTAARVSITRTGNKLCGTSDREYQHTHDGQTCILDEADRINGEVTAKGEFWVDLDFDWKEKGGICGALTLPCSGKVTWGFVLAGHELKNGTYDAEVTEVREDTCNSQTVAVGAPTSSYFISATSGSFSFCLEPPSTFCREFDRSGDTVTYSGSFNWEKPSSCAGTETIEGTITSPTTFRLVRTRETASSCGFSCRVVFVMHFTYRGP